MSVLRYATNCVTGVRRWFRVARAGRPERSGWWPCAKAALAGAPLLAGPGNVAGGGLLSPPVNLQPGEGPPAAPGTLIVGGGGDSSPRHSQPGASPPTIPGTISPPWLAAPPQPPVSMPEPGTLRLLAAAVAAALLLRRLQCA